MIFINASMSLNKVKMPQRPYIETNKQAQQLSRLLLKDPCSLFHNDFW